MIPDDDPARSLTVVPDGGGPPPHFFRNTSGAPARMLCMCTPAGQEEYFRRVGTTVDGWDAPPPQLSDDERADQRSRAADLAATYRSEFL
jgi:hypothetical protein